MKWKEIVIFLAAALALGWFINSLIDKNIELREKLNEQIKITADYEKRINSLHELDTKHTTELTNAKAEIDQLRIDVINGTKRLRIKAECPKPENSSTSSVDASGSPSLARDAEQDYFDLLKQLETLEKQYLGLRDYYYAECKR
ncbi:lysis protein [Providencia rettgeri]|uniref:lysis protein n=1 Tax=Providencia rettgeri TaxID=587 RepID=UPI001ADB0321|nr:lysis protein [Providencia rettgeri]MBO8254902.1 lysis protein [Providencia rettgeri]MBO8259089.1 lysis protein [Providencia rettgeri]MDE4731220.1 lysis protein [Providencia rettgeri]